MLTVVSDLLDLLDQVGASNDADAVLQSHNTQPSTTTSAHRLHSPCTQQAIWHAPLSSEGRCLR